MLGIHHEEDTLSPMGYLSCLGRSCCTSLFWHDYVYSSRYSLSHLLVSLTITPALLLLFDETVFC